MRVCRLETVLRSTSCSGDDFEVGCHHGVHPVMGLALVAESFAQQAEECAELGEQYLAVQPEPVGAWAEQAKQQAKEHTNFLFATNAETEFVKAAAGQTEECGGARVGGHHDGADCAAGREAGARHSRVVVRRF